MTLVVDFRKQGRTGRKNRRSQIQIRGQVFDTLYRVCSSSLLWSDMSTPPGPPPALEPRRIQRPGQQLSEQAMLVSPDSVDVIAPMSTKPAHSVTAIVYCIGSIHYSCISAKSSWLVSRRGLGDFGSLTLRCGIESAVRIGLERAHRTSSRL